VSSLCYSAIICYIWRSLSCSANRIYS